MMRRNVSILIPAYNAERWISDTIRSALSQTWPNIEVIIIDDGSTDATLEVSRRFESPRCRVIRQPNGGACSARNHALRECQGDFIQWLDADDLLAPDKVEKQMRAAEACDDPWTVFSGAWGEFSYRPARARFRPTPLWRDLDAVNWLVGRIGNPWMVHPAVWLVSRQLTDEAGPWDESLLRNQDGEYFCRVVSRARFVKFVPESRSYYRIANAHSVSNSRSEEALESFSRSIEQEVRHLLDREDSLRTREACAYRLSVGAAVLENAAPEYAGRLRRRIASLGCKVEPITLSRKLTLVGRLIGRRNATAIRDAAWNMRRTVSVCCDFLLSKFTGDRLD